MDFDGITLVTGAAGFMGSHMVERLAANGCRVRATARPGKETSFFDRLGVEFVGADLTRPETLPPLFDGPVDRVIHLGAICNFSTPYAALRPTNVDGVGHIASLAMGAGVKRFVHVTSTSVYGRYPGVPFVETGRREPKDNYGRSKRDGEDVLFQAVKAGLPAVVVRPCTVYGPRCNDGAGKAFSRPSAIAAIPGHGRQLLSNIRAEDVAAAVDHLSCLDEAQGEVYNLADDSHPSLAEALRLAAQTYGSREPTLHLPLFLIRALARIDGIVSRRRGKIPDLEYDAAVYLSDDYVVDNTKLKATGFEFIYPDFVQSMAQMGRWYRSQKD